MKRQTGASMTSLLLALILVGATLLAAAAMGAQLLRLHAQREDFTAVMTDVLTSVEYAIVDDWAETGCRALSEPPTLTELVNQYQAPESILTTPYGIDIDYLSSPTNHISSTIKLSVTLPSSLSGQQLSSAAHRVADDIRVSQTTITLYRAVSSINSSLQHQYFDGETGCMQEDFQ